MSVPRRPVCLLFLVVASLVAVGCSSAPSAGSVIPVPEPAEVPTTAVMSRDEPAAEPAATPRPRPTRAAATTTTSATTTEVTTQDSAQDGEYASIRDVDFRNDFTYETGLDFGPEATVTESAYENGDWGDEDYFGFYIGEIVYGDFDGDGSEDAAVQTSWNGGGSGYFDSVTAFRLIGGRVASAGKTHFGDRADGGINDLQVSTDAAGNDQLFVWSFAGGEGACCPTEIRRSTMVLGDFWLVEAEGTPARAWLALDAFREPVVELSFLPGTSSGLVTSYGYEPSGSFQLEASAGQRLEVSLVHGAAPNEVSIRHLASNQKLDAGQTTLPADGFYEVAIFFDDDHDTATLFEVTIDGDESATGPTWQPAIAQTVITEEPFVRTAVLWPVFTSDQPGATQANAMIASFAAELDDVWIQDVTEFETPLDDSSYDNSYQVTLATSEVVSVRFNFFEYVCCRPYPNYGQRGAVLDLAAGRIMSTGEILDLNRISEINDIWFAALDRQDIVPVDRLILDTSEVHFDAVALVPGGVEFGTDRGSLGGGLPGTSTVVTFAELGDLVDPTLVQRVANG